MNCPLVEGGIASAQKMAESLEGLKNLPYKCVA